MMASFNDKKSPLKPNWRPQNGDSRILMCVGCMVALLVLDTGTNYKYEHPYHPSAEATLASLVPSLLIPVPVPTSIDLLAWQQPVRDDYFYLYSFMPGLSWNTSLRPAAASMAIAIAAPVSLALPTPCKKNISESTIQYLKKPAVLVEKVATIAACYFLWIGPLPSILIKLAATSKRLRVVSNVARRVKFFKPFQKIWKAIASIYKNRSKLSIASEYTFYFEASASSVDEEKENLESSPNPTFSRSNNRTKKITTVHSRNATKQPSAAKLIQF
jgi:hypothetical protein